MFWCSESCPLFGVSFNGGSTVTVVCVLVTLAYNYGDTPLPPQLADFDPFPVLVRCPYCQQQVTTEVHYQPGRTTWLACALTALLCCGM